MRNFLKVTITPPAGSATVHSGYVLTILRQNHNGSWVIARDANLLTPESGA
jgi:ketosteroid isomerase-like protein